MPELPEVETVRRQLASRLSGTRIEQLHVLDRRWCEPQTVGQITKEVSEKRLVDVSRRGKYIALDFEESENKGPSFLLMHLRMTGNLIHVPDRLDPSANRHLRAYLELGQAGSLLFVDPRRFGSGRFIPTRRELDRYLDARLGPEPLGQQFDSAYLREHMNGRALPTKAFLLNQKEIAGIGNIYADEALFQAGIHPLQPAGTLNGAEIDRLRDSVVASLEAGLSAGGASIDDFRHYNGARGSMQERFLVHRRAGRPCPSCGKVIEKLRAAGRGTYICPNCQRLRRRAIRKA